MASTSSKVTLKLLIDTKNQKVLFAEASKAVIDFLFNLLRLPVGTVVRLLSKNGMVGSIGNLYQSVENLNENYMQPNLHKDALLKPSSIEISGLLPSNTYSGNVHDDFGTKFYMCLGRCNSNVTCDNKTVCQCGRVMATEVRYVGKKVTDQENISLKSGFVKEIVTFMVMDDLVVEPMSTISSITLLNKFNVKEVGTLQEKVVDLGMPEGIKLLKAALQTKMVLTSVFLNKNLF